MNNKKIPPPPVLPPSFNLKENFCLLHKGPIEGEIYTCPSCKTTYCLKCVQKAKTETKLCVKCKKVFFV